MHTGNEVKAWFKDNYRNRLDLDDLISDQEWERSAKAKGNTFPPCQYSPGLQSSSDNGECGIVLLGDAAHAFSPDIGQGINAGLMDVVQFDKILATTNRSIEGSLGRALTEYERIGTRSESSRRVVICSIQQSHVCTVHYSLKYILTSYYYLLTLYFIQTNQPTDKGFDPSC